MDEDDIETESEMSQSDSQGSSRVEPRNGYQPLPSFKRKSASSRDEISPPPSKRQKAAPNDHRSSTTFVASPFKLMTVRDLPESANRDTLSLSDLLGNPLLKECWLFDFLFDVDFIMSHFEEDMRSRVKVKIVHGSWKREDPNGIGIEEACKKWPNVQQVKAWMPSPFGTHHSKMMILFRHDDCAQIVIHTANMIARDWTNMTEAMWLSPLLPLLPSQSDVVESNAINTVPGAVTGPRNSPLHPIGGGARFKDDLLRYLRSYGSSRTSSLTTQLMSYDFGAVRGAFIASIPSSVTGSDLQHSQSESRTLWGRRGLREVLAQIQTSRKAVPPDDCPRIVVQVSSIATLTTKWAEDFLDDLRQASNVLGAQDVSPECRIMFPTVDEVRNSLDGYAAGASIHFKTRSLQQAKLLAHFRPHLVKWTGKRDEGESSSLVDAGRRRAVPHIKTYTRFTSQAMDRIDWALLSSANLSTQAWGGAFDALDETMKISSYEVGILVWPALFDDGGEVNIASKTIMVPTFGHDVPVLNDAIEADVRKIVGVRMAYDRPLAPYGNSEQPWGASANYDEPDRMGVAWKGSG